MADLDMEGFLGHDPNAGGGGRGKFLRGWRDRKPPEVNIWLHTAVMFTALWQHNLQRVVVRKDRKTGEEKEDIWGNSWNCWEPEAIVSNRNRDWNTGEREAPYTICPVCKMIEWVRGCVRRGEMQPEDVVFRYVTPNGAITREIHAAGLYNGLDDDRFTKEQRAAISNAGIKLSESWKENQLSKCNYMFCVVDHDEPEAGIQIAIETGLLGDKMKSVIRKLRKKLGEQGNWNPLVTPYAFNWEHKPSAKVFNDKYDADDRIGALPLTPDIEALIKGPPPQDQIDKIKAHGRLREIRDQFEQFACFEMPWDEFFGEAEILEKQRADADADFPYGANVDGDDAPVDVAAADAAMAQAAAETQVQPKPAPVAQAKAPAAAPAPAAAKPVPAKPAAAAGPAPTAQAPAQPPAQPAAAAPTAGGRRKVEQKPKFEPVFVKCDDCPEMVREDQEVCHGCGCQYGIDDDVKAKYKDAPPLPKPDAGTHGDTIKF